MANTVGQIQFYSHTSMHCYIQIKCEQYWNEEINATYEPGRNLRVTMTSNKVMTGFEVRQFRVEKVYTYMYI